MEASFRAISDETRRRILQLVSQNEMTASEIANHFSITRPGISQHLAILKSAGLIVERRAGTKRLYRVDRRALTAAKLFLDGFWDDRLGRLVQLSEESSSVLKQEDSERISLEKEIVIRATPQDVWQFLTDPRQMKRWMGKPVSLSVESGGSYCVEVVAGEFVRGAYIQVEPYKTLSHTWGWETSDMVTPGSTIVTYALLPTAAGTLLYLNHRNLPSVEATASHSNGWNHYLSRLAQVAGGKRVEPDPWFNDTDKLLAELGKK